MTRAPAYPDEYRTYQPRPGHALKLVCFPHAGGAASFYRAWSRHLPDSVQLLVAQYPGREDRITEEPVSEMADLADRLAASLAGSLDTPFALFGHSMGAAVAYEVELRLEQRWGRTAQRLIVSGRPAPHRGRHTTVHQRDDDELVAELDRLGGTAAEVLEQADLRDLLLPTIRADYRLIERYRPDDPVPVSAPVTAVIGDTDPEVDHAEAAAWADGTGAGFELWTMPGNHFYLTHRERELVTRLLQAMGLPPSSRAWPSTP